VRARLLGSGGWMPTNERETFCLLLVDGVDALCVDAGTGFRRLVTDPSLLTGVERLHIVLTHWHLDHTCGLVCLPAVDVPVELWGPPPARELAHRLLDPPFLLAEETHMGRNLEGIHDLESPSTRVGPFHVAVRVQELHPSSTRALRVGDLAICTDTAADAENVAFARGARILLHEAFHAGEASDDEMHTAAGEAARIAAAAGVERLVLVHVHPLETSDEDLVRDARRYFEAVEVGRDGLVLEPV
jgi:ribonuclease BN (tRNA processing enzyme)